MPSQMQLFVIAPSPLVKICLPEWESRLASDPKLVLDTQTPFSFDVSTGTNTFRLAYDTPIAIVYDNTKYIQNKSDFFPDAMTACKLVPAVMRKDIIRVRDPQELENVFLFLTGINGGMAAKQTDSYGIVPFDPENEIVLNYEEGTLIDEILSSDAKVAEEGKRKLIQSRLAMAKNRKEKLVALRAASEERIKNHLRRTHNNLIAQWRRNDEAKLGRYSPSMAEIMGFKVLDPEIRSKDDATAEAARMGNEMLQRSIVGVG